MTAAKRKKKTEIKMEEILGKKKLSYLKMVVFSLDGMFLFYVN